MSRFLIALVLFLAATSFREGPAAQGTAARTADRFSGTWKLVSTERRGPDGKVIPPDNPNTPVSLGYIVYDPAGYMAVTIMPPGRPKYAGENPTPDEARRALAGYTSYWGPYTINESERVITHHAQGALSLSMSGVDQRRGYEFNGNRLTLKPPVGPSGIQSSLTWERVPELPSMTPAQKRFVGFYRLVSNERRNAKSEVVGSNPGQTGYIVYTASGHMMAHLMQPKRGKYAGAQPTGTEALAALNSYTSYFGTFTVHERDGYVMHHRLGHLNPGQTGSDVQRFYQFSGRNLILKPPPTTVDGQQVQGTLTWERLGTS